ncbi:histidine kinase [Bacillus manliponensis]|uniref:Histidine kinase n=1 Tax=Bacillus manliponensis TaxID=574376 RepID=A0A073K3I0_9BACI|nr:tetratricopeptide repeat protein [Bacillus manliponensis]KEK21151.1 histidine kinase [Bacillus manliponensis]
MFTSTRNERITQLLNEWYIEIRSRRLQEAQCLKEQIDIQINRLKEEVDESMQDQNLLLYYSLLDFRFNYLADNLNVSKDSFDKIEAFNVPMDNFLSYYYHFFKAIHCDAIGNYMLAKEHYYKAEELLRYVPDELEKAEFYYKMGYSHYDNQRGLQAIKEVTKAKDIFSNNAGYETNVAFCDNMLGLACIHLKEWELAEEHLTSAMDKFQKIGEENFILIVRHNLGWLYANQNLSELAIRYLSEVIEKTPKQFRAIYVKAKEHYKLKEHEAATELIEKGLAICNDLQNEGYLHHFKILKALNENIPAEELEKIVIKGIAYFDREELYEYKQEYEEKLAVKFYEEDNHKKASSYFYGSTQSKQNSLNKGALR